jgi:uncharacterized RDD family membrane protein YckC
MHSPSPDSPDKSHRFRHPFGPGPGNDYGYDQGPMPGPPTTLILSAVPVWPLRGFLLLVLWCGYEYAFLIKRDGQTLGKKMQRLCVRKADGSPLDDNSVLIRTGLLYAGSAIAILGAVSAGLGFLGFLIALGVVLSPLLDGHSKRYQGIHDKASKTMVVKV